MRVTLHSLSASCELLPVSRDDHSLAYSAAFDGQPSMSMGVIDAGI